jgi:FtsP/CotA-like multicopper oxidase with cupredoxin domain
MDRRAFLAGAAAGAAPIVAGRGLPDARAQAGPEVPVGFTRLRVVEGTLTVAGKTGKVYRIQQDDGTLGYVGARGSRFRVALENATSAPTSIHWHGLILPNGQDGVPYVTQAPIKPGERRLYDFPLVQAGTYWMHSHFGLQEQPMMTAPLILHDPAAPRPEEQEVVVILNDFTTRSPEDILAGLRGQRGAGATPPGAMAGMRGGVHGAAGSGAAMPGASGSGGARGPMGGMAMGPRRAGGRDLTDVQYDAFLANRRPLSDPDVVRVLPGRTVRLRIINAASATNFFVQPGRLRAEAVAIDGEDVVPFVAPSYELAIAQRIDLRVAIPRAAGAHPILAQGEGTDMLAGIVLATPGAAVPALSARARSVAGALPNTQERRLRAIGSLASRPVDRRLRLTLDGNMARYAWMLNGQAWPRITPLPVKQGERVELAFVNETGMAHPMHLHGHVFQVTAIDGRPLRGARRDTVLVLPKQTIAVQFDAAYPGYWMLHCHLLYHQAAGMQTVLHYEGFENRSYDPMASLSEFAR